MDKEDKESKQRAVQKEITHLVEMGKTLKRRQRDPREVTAAIELTARLLRIRDRRGRFRRLEANPAQRQFEEQRGRQNIVLKARQMGITTWIAGRFFLKTILGRGVMTVQVAHTREAAEGIFRMVQRFWECLPEDLRNGPLRRSIANVGAMRFPELDSEFRVLSASDPNAGRGLTMQNLHLSEVGRWPGDATETLTGLLAALAPGGEIVMESTPNGAYGCFYHQWGQAVAWSREAMELDMVIRHFFPWWLERAYTAPSATDLTLEEEGLVARYGLTREQIGYRRGLARTHWGLRSQEFAEDPETCFRATGNCCFDVEAIEARLAAVGKPLESRRNGALLVWLPYRSDKQYILGVDSAGGGEDGDFAAVQVIELHTGLQCAELRERLKASDLAAAAAALSREYGHALLAVERNNHGAAVVAYLQHEGMNERLYKPGNTEGWATTAASKPGMVAFMGSLLSENAEIFLSSRLLAECRTFVAFGDGRTGAINGAHDDCFMAMAVAQSVRMEMLNKGGKRQARPLEIVPRTS